MKFKNLNIAAKVIAGQSPPSTTYNTTGEGLPFFQGKADFQEKYPKVRSWCNSEKKKEALPGDILMSVRAPVGPVNICNQKAVIGRGISAIRPLKGTNGDYLYYFLKSNEQKIAGLGTGSTFKAITQQVLGKIQIPLPPHDDQIRIATLLRRVEALIATRKDNLRLLDEFLKSTFLEMFGNPLLNEKGWDKPELKNNFGEITTGNTPPRSNIENYSSEFIEWIKTDNIDQDHMFLTQALEYLSETGAKKARIAQSDALLVACIAGSIESIGRAALTNRNVAFNQQINAIQPYADIDPLFLYWLFRISKIYVQSFAPRGMKKIITKGNFEKITMIKPPKYLQDQFAHIGEKVESLKPLYLQSLKELEHLYDALSQKAFKGELDLNRIPLDKAPEKAASETTDEPADPFAKIDSFVMSDPAEREQLLRQLFDAFIAERKGASLSLDDFWTQAEQKVADDMDEESPPLGVADYDKARAWLFELLKSGQANQHFNEENNRMELGIKG
jgi:type I restriction enzyme S subunit